MKNIILALGISVLFSYNIFSQADNIQLGSGMTEQRSSLAGYFDYSNASGINIKVNVWGFVRYPGKYIIPAGSRINDLLSYAGGPTDEARLEDLRVIRTNEDSTQSVIDINYKDILFNKGFTKIDLSHQLKAGDVLLVTGSPRLYFKDYFSLTLSVVSVLITLSILILNVVKN